MYEDYWQLESKPFEPIGDSRFVFPCSSHQAAIHKLRYAIESRRAAGLLAGTSGTGKTLLIQTLQQQLDNTIGNFVQVVFPLMSSHDLLVYLAEQLGAPQADPSHYTVEESLRRLELALRESSRSGKHTVLIIDEAHLLEDSGLLEPLRLLLNLGAGDAGGQSLFTLLFVGQPALLAAMQRNTALDERLDIKVLIKPFTAEETAGYIEHRLRTAGATRSIFSTDALQVAHQLSNGSARRINRLCDLALLVGYAAEQHSIDAEHLQAVNNELVTVAAAA